MIEQLEKRIRREGEITMRYLKYFALLAVLMLPLTYAQAQVRVGVGIGIGPAVVAGPPVCAYGYYPYAPYACAPYGYYGPNFFVNGVFIGAGPWFHGLGHPYYGYPGRGFYHGPVERFHGGPGFRGGWHR